MSNPLIDAAYLAQLRTNRAWALKAEILDGLTGDVLGTLTQAITGTINEQREKVRRKVSLEIAGVAGLVLDSSLVGKDATYGEDGDTYGGMGGYYGQYEREQLDGLLVPGVNEIRLSRGLKVRGRGWVWIGEGVYRIDDYSAKESRGGLSVAIKGSDRSARISANRWTEPHVIEAGTNYVTALRTLVLDRYPQAQFSLPTTNYSAPRIVLGLESDNDPWVDAQRLATALGGELYFDGDGIVTMSKLVELRTATPVDTLTDDEMRMTLSVGRSLTADQVYNGVTVYSDNSTSSDQVIKVSVWDEDPASRTYYKGGFGKKPYFFSSALIDTVAMALETADSLLADVKGFEQVVDVEMVMHTGLNAGDVLVVESAKAGVEGNVLIESMSKPFDTTGTMTFQATRTIA